MAPVEVSLTQQVQELLGEVLVRMGKRRDYVQEIRLPNLA